MIDKLLIWTYKRSFGWTSKVVPGWSFLTLTFFTNKECVHELSSLRMCHQYDTGKNGLSLATKDRFETEVVRVFGFPHESENGYSPCYCGMPVETSWVETKNVSIGKTEKKTIKVTLG